MAVYVFVVYGSVMGLAYLGVEGEFHQLQHRSRWLKYPAVLLLMFVGAKLLTLAVAIAATLLGLIPEPRPIWEHPWF